MSQKLVQRSQHTDEDFLTLLRDLRGWTAILSLTYEDHLAMFSGKGIYTIGGVGPLDLEDPESKIVVNLLNEPSVGGYLTVAPDEIHSITLLHKRSAS
jgi:hypothetical protein